MYQNIFNADVLCMTFFARYSLYANFIPAVKYKLPSLPKSSLMMYLSFSNFLIFIILNKDEQE